MAHTRTTIRTALEALLTPALAPTVLYVERHRPIGTEERPCVVLSLPGDVIDTDMMTMDEPAYRVEHEQSVVVELHVDGSDGDVVAPAIDALELTVEAALASDLTLGGVLENLTPVSSELESNADQDRVLGVRTILYNATWRSSFGSPDVPEG